MHIFKGGLIGYGMIGKTHAIVYNDLPLCYSQPEVNVDMVALLVAPSSSDRQNRNETHFQLVTNDPDEFFNQSLDFVDVCSPNHWHYFHVKSALQAKLPVYCEKPLARTVDEARELATLANGSEILNQVAFVNRFLPAIRQMKAVINAGVIGEVLNFRAHKFHQSYLDPQRPMSWRLRLAEAGGGAMLDLGIHLVDLVYYLFGDIERLQAEMRTFIKMRPTQANREKFEPVKVDDWALATIETSGGIPGVIEVSRMAAGSGEATAFEVFGSLGAIAYHHTHPEAALIYNLKRKLWMQGNSDLPSDESERQLAAIYPSSKFSQGAMTNRHMASQHDFLLNLKEHKPAAIDFNSAVKAQQAVEAAYQSAALDSKWIRLSR